MSRVKVATLNIWNRSGPWEARAALIRRELAELGADIVGFQEVLSYDGRSQVDELNQDLHHFSAFGRASDLGGGVVFGNAVLSRWPIEAQQVFTLPTGATDEHRSLLAVSVASPHGKIPFFVTHLNWKFHHGIVRERQVVAIAEHVMRVAPVGEVPPIVVGDFNAQPQAAEIRFLKGLQSLEGRSVYLADCFEQTGDGDGCTYDGHRNPYAAPLQEPLRRIDYIFVRGPDQRMRGKPLASKVVFDVGEGGVWPSDHFGVYAEISI